LTIGTHKYVLFSPLLALTRHLAVTLNHHRCSTSEAKQTINNHNFGSYITDLQNCTVSCISLDCLTQVDRWHHSVSDVVEYVTTKKVTRIYFQHPSCIHMPVGNSNTLGLYWLIISYVEAFLLKEWTTLIAFINWEFLTWCLLAIINRTHAFLKFKMAARQKSTFSTIVLKIGTTFLTPAPRKTEATARSAEQLPQ
jgi:hypothetical protein